MDNKIINFLVGASFSAVVFQVGTLAGHIFTLLPVMEDFAPAAGVVLYGVACIANKMAYGSIFPKDADRITKRNKLASASITIITPAFVAAFTGTAIIPAMVSTAVLAGIIWFIRPCCTIAQRITK